MNEEDYQTKAALNRVMQECLNYPDKKKDFIREGTLDLLLELCRSQKRLGIKAHAAACLAVLCHQNNSAKTELLELGASRTLLSMCRPFGENINSENTRMEKLLCHEQSAALLQKLTYENTSCQNELVNAGIIRHLLQLCNVFTPNSCHSNCCQVNYRYSKEANDAFSDLVINKKLIGNVTELSKEETATKIERLLQSGTEMHCFGDELTKIYNIDLYDTTSDKDIQISQELKAKELVWPDMSCVEDTCDERLSSSSEVKGVWSDISVLQVIDAGHFWAHVGGEFVKKNIHEIQGLLQTQDLSLQSEVPQPGSLVCTLQKNHENKIAYRGRVLDVSTTQGTTRAKVFAIDFGFTAIVPGDAIYSVPASLVEYPPQVSLCCLAGVQAPPENASVLEYAVGALRNLCEINEDFISYVATTGGIETLLKLCVIPNRNILLQVVNTLTNIACDFRYRARVGYLGGIKLLLDLCLQYPSDVDILIAVVGTIQNLLVKNSINRSRALDAHGLVILISVYSSAKHDNLKNRALRALTNLIGKPSNEVSKDGTKKKVDMRGIVNDNPNAKPKFSLSISTDDGFRPGAREARSIREDQRDIERAHRRRARRAKGLVDPKPTQVHMSLDSLDKQVNGDESDTSESDDSYSGRWTSETDVDTDGEMLIKNSNTSHIPSYTKLAETLSSSRYYIQTHHMPFTEDETHEFSSQTNVHDISKRKISKTLCAFLNNKKSGTIYVGVRSSGEICGVRVGRKERDLLRLGLDEMVDRFKPSLKHDMYKIDFIPVVRPSGHESTVTRKLIEDRYVIEIALVKVTGLIYTTPQGKCLFRLKSANIELTSQEVRERSIVEQERTYNEEISRLRQELKGMRVQLNERSRTTASELELTKPEMDTNTIKDTNTSETKPEKDTITSEYTNEVQAGGCLVM